MKTKVLVVEDRLDMAELICHHLEKEGYLTIHSFDGEEALRIIQEEKVDFVLLDMMLPKISGIEVLKRIKQDETTKNIPVIIESAKSEDEDVVLGLELGAEDYITKPFSPKVLLARMQKVLQRNSSNKVDELIFNHGELFVNLSSHEVTVQGNVVSLTMAEFGILVSLLKNQSKIMSRDQLLDDVWQNKSIVVDRVIDVHINSLRKKLGSVSDSIHTIRGVGYMFKAKLD
jgi:two-component system alkaline phosphatase synthesis response regulator PhoP